jgi:endo-1,4-beta-D-glucanase Y
MRAKSGGVYTNLKDRNDPPDPSAVYPYGHHQTAEHMGLMTWMAAAMMDHEAFEQCYDFVLNKMTSPRRDVVNWAIDKVKGTPMLQREDKQSPWLNSNAPLDDFRVVKGLISGYMQWKDERYLNLALRIGNGLLETSVSKPDDFPKYPGGVVAYAYNWPENAGLGITDVVVIPIDYADLWTMRWLADYQPGWNKVIQENIKMMEASQIPTSGQYWNSYLQETKQFSGDFEYRDVIAGQKIKAIQSLWIGIHLARLGRKASAQKSLDFYKKHYAKYQRIDEYLNPDGSPCTESYFDKTLKMGEARIYSQAARLAYYLGDNAFGDKMIQEKILPDQDLTPTSVTYGNIGKSTAGTGDAEAWNNLESLIALTFQMGSPVVNHVFNN